ncbi:cytochrome P450 [Nocardioides ferulae]|uniref:cytochrome P450 n=1 Tax=Nocardioides ferulae TaxID=2340821 RepID=UPI000EB1EF92|nr:cytochrome P450 [Nocardioides ferulae]
MTVSTSSTTDGGSAADLTAIPEVSYAVPDDGHGHLAELRTDPIGLLERVRAECGDIGRFRLADRDVVMVSGAVANEQFFRAPDETLDQAAAYPFMTPIFGKGVVFDASPEERQQMLKNQALRGDMMRGHATTIEAEIRRMVAGWGEEGEIDLLDFFAELTIYTTSACLIGKPFREELDGRFARHYHDLEKGTDAMAYVDAYADLPSFRQRDAARVELVALVQAIIDKRVARGPVPKEERDLLDVLISIGMESDYITGIFISMMFAGHHTTSGTASWALIELMRHPDAMGEVIAELDELYADGSEVSFQALRSIPRLEAVLKETLRLHPPLIVLLRVVAEQIELGGHPIPVGTMVAASPRVSNRIGTDFPDPEAFDPGRYIDPRQEDLANRWTWIPFGAGRHRCVGNAFAMMQMKAIFSVLLRDYSFEMAQPSESYRDDVSKMVIQLEQPCRVRYRRRVSASSTTGAASSPSAAVVEPASSAAEAAETPPAGCPAHAPGNGA